MGRKKPPPPVKGQTLKVRHGATLETPRTTFVVVALPRAIAGHARRVGTGKESLATVIERETRRMVLRWRASRQLRLFEPPEQAEVNRDEFEQPEQPEQTELPKPQYGRKNGVVWCGRCPDGCCEGEAKIRSCDVLASIEQEKRRRKRRRKEALASEPHCNVCALAETEPSEEPCRTCLADRAEGRGLTAFRDEMEATT